MLTRRHESDDEEGGDQECTRFVIDVDLSKIGRLQLDGMLRNKGKHMDLIVRNSMQDEGAGFGTDTNKVTMIDRKGMVEKYELKPKVEVAVDLVRRVVKMIDDA